MTAKQFFRGTAFRSVLVLLLIVILSGGILAICNDLLAIDENDTTNRLISKLYGGKKVQTESLEIPEGADLYEYGSVSKAYRVLDDGNYVLNVTGFEGYRGGTVTVWLVAEFKDEAFTGIGKVQYETSEQQTLMANFNQSYFDAFDAFDEAVVSGGVFGVEEDNGIVCNVVTGATRSSNAICNAVNTAIEFVKTVILDEPEPGPDPEPVEILFEKNMRSVEVEVNGATVVYNLRVKTMGDPDPFSFRIAVTNGKIDSFEITDNGSTDGYDAHMYPDIEQLFLGKDYAAISALLNTETVGSDTIGVMDSSLQTGASYSNLICLTAAAYATGNYAYYAQTAEPVEILFEKNIRSVETEVNGTTVVYNLRVKTMGDPDPFSFRIAVTDGKIDSFEITDNGSTDGYDAHMYPDIEQLFLGKDYAAISALLNTETVGSDTIGVMDSSLQTGASYSNLICLTAAAYATGNYNAYLSGGAK